MACCDDQIPGASQRERFVVVRCANAALDSAWTDTASDSLLPKRPSRVY